MVRPLTPQLVAAATLLYIGSVLYSLTLIWRDSPDIKVLPFGVAVFQGHYDAQNISQGTPLVLFEAVPCVQLIRLITGYDFLPDSNNAAIMPGGDLTSPTPMSATETVKGTYSKGIQLTPLASGIYTVVAGDEWGTLEFLYINVK